MSGDAGDAVVSTLADWTPGLDTADYRAVRSLICRASQLKASWDLCSKSSTNSISGLTGLFVMRSGRWQGLSFTLCTNMLDNIQWIQYLTIQINSQTIQYYSPYFFPDNHLVSKPSSWTWTPYMRCVCWNICDWPVIQSPEALLYFGPLSATLFRWILLFHPSLLREC